jgi:hypothetical protein
MKWTVKLDLGGGLWVIVKEKRPKEVWCHTTYKTMTTPDNVYMYMITYVYLWICVLDYYYKVEKHMLHF